MLGYHSDWAINRTQISSGMLGNFCSWDPFWDLYHMMHFSEGFMGESTGQLKASAKYLELAIVPNTLKYTKHHRSS